MIFKALNLYWNKLPRSPWVLLTLSVLLSANFLAAQESNLKFTLSYGYLNYYSSNQQYNSAIKGGFFAPNLTFPTGIEVSYATFNVTNDYNFTGLDPNTTREKYRINYVDIHLYLSTKNLLNEKTKLYLSTGPVLNRMVRWRQVNSFDNQSSMEVDTPPLSNKLGWSWRIGGALEKNISNWDYLRLGIYQDVRLKSIYNQDAAPEKTVGNNSSSTHSIPPEKGLVFGVDFGFGILLF